MYIKKNLKTLLFSLCISWLKNGSRLKTGWCEKDFSARIGCNLDSNCKVSDSISKPFRSYK